MKNFKITQQTDIIDDLMEHLINGMMGIAMAHDWDYERSGNTIHFNLKEGHEMKLDVIFWLGYFTNS